MSRSALLALALTLGACASPAEGPGVLVRSSSVPFRGLALSPAPELADVTAWAAAEWREAGASVAVSDGGLPVAFGAPRAGDLGDYSPGRRIVVLEGLAGDQLAMTVLHEVGHALGLGHLPAGVMRERWDGTAVLCIDDEAAQAAGGLRGTCP